MATGVTGASGSAQIHRNPPGEANTVAEIVYQWGNPPLEDMKTRLAVYRAVESENTLFFTSVYVIEALFHGVVYLLVTNPLTRIVNISAALITCNFGRVSSEIKDGLVSTAQSISFIFCAGLGYLHPLAIFFPKFGMGLEKEAPITEATFNKAVKDRVKKQVDDRLASIEAVMGEAARAHVVLSDKVTGLSSGIDVLTRNTGAILEEVLTISASQRPILNKLSTLEERMARMARDDADRHMIVVHSLSRELPRQIGAALVASSTPSALPSEGISGAPSTPTRALPLPPKKEFMKFFNEMKECYTAVTREIAYVKIPTTKDVGRVIAVIRQISQSLYQRRGDCHGDVRATLENCLKPVRAISETCKSRGVTKDEFVGWLENLSRALMGLVNKIAYVGMSNGVISQEEYNDSIIRATSFVGRSPGTKGKGP